MPNMTIKGIPADLLDRLKGRAAREHRSLNAEVIALLEAALAEPTGPYDHTDWEAFRSQTLILREELRERYGQLSDSTALIREDRDR